MLSPWSTLQFPSGTKIVLPSCSPPKRYCTTSDGYRPTADEEEPVFTHLPGAMRRQSCERKEGYLGYRRGKSFPDYIQDSTGKALVEDDEGSRTAIVTAGKVE